MPQNTAPDEIRGSSDEMMRKREESIAKVSANWPFFGTPKIATLPAVMSALWRAEDGHLGLFIMNLSEVKQSYCCAFDPPAYGLTSERLRYTRIQENGPGDSFEVQGGVQVRSEDLEPFGGVVYDIGPAGT